MFSCCCDTQLVSIFVSFQKFHAVARICTLNIALVFITASERSSTFYANLETFSIKLFMISSLSFLSCLYLFNFLVIKSTASLSSCWWLSPLSCFYSSLVLSNICVTYFSIFFMKFNNIVTHCRSFELSVNKSSAMSLDILVFKLPSLGFLDVSASLELLLKSLFF